MLPNWQPVKEEANPKRRPFQNECKACEKANPQAINTIDPGINSIVQTKTIPVNTKTPKKTSSCIQLIKLLKYLFKLFLFIIKQITKPIKTNNTITFIIFSRFFQKDLQLHF